MRCDLHMHSTYSDGQSTVPELVHAVHAAGVSVFSLTDHDTVEGLAPAAEEARRLGLRLVAGVELSTRLRDMELHILGYGFNPEHPGLLALLDAQKQARHDRIPKMVEKLNELGLELSVEDVYSACGQANPGRPHVAQALILRGHVRDREEAFRRYLGDRAPANLAKAVPSPQAAISAIHEAGGKAVWAHPLGSSVRHSGGHSGLARELAAQGLDGLELVHPCHDAGGRKRLQNLANELGLHGTGGSDFHGPRDGSLEIGRGQVEVPVAAVDTLLA